MFSLLFSSLLATTAVSAAPADNQTAISCTADRLRPYVGPTGVHQSWPVATQLPTHLDGQLGLLLSGQGNVDDGYTHWLLVDERSATSYVVQRGGFAGFQTIYGPLPVAACSRVPPNNSFKPKPLRGSA